MELSVSYGIKGGSFQVQTSLFLLLPDEIDPLGLFGSRTRGPRQVNGDLCVVSSRCSVRIYAMTLFSLPFFQPQLYTVPHPRSLFFLNINSNPITRLAAH